MIKKIDVLYNNLLRQRANKFFAKNTKQSNALIINSEKMASLGYF